MNLIGRGGNVGNERSQATRARDHADLAVGQTGLVETLGDHGTKLLDGIVQRCRGHFLRTDLKQESLASAMAYATSPSWSAFSLTPATSAM